MPNIFRSLGARRSGYFRSLSTIARTWRRACSSPLPVSTTKSARFLFSVSGSWRDSIEVEPFGGHAGPGEGARSLNGGRRGYHHDGAEVPARARSRKAAECRSAPVSRREPARRRGRLPQLGAPEDESRPRSRSSKEASRATACCQTLPVDGIVDDGIGTNPAYRGDPFAASGIERMHGGVRIEYRNTVLGKHAGGRGLAHGDRTGKADDFHGRRGPAFISRSMSSSSSRRSSTVTSGRTPNHFSKPGWA